jgi:hypothetical protein
LVLPINRFFPYKTNAALTQKISAGTPWQKFSSAQAWRQHFFPVFAYKQVFAK